MSTEIEARIARLEAIEAIRQLVQGYGLALDARDVDAIVGLYVDNVRVGGGKQGREALKNVFNPVLRQFTSSAHLMMNHVYEFLGPDDAIGLVLARVEHEVGDKWVTGLLLYHDRYTRRNGRWYFRGRMQTRLYMTSHDDPPLGDLKIRWPGSEPSDGAYYEALPSWDDFWAGAPGEPADEDVADHLVSRLRRSIALPPPPNYTFP